MNNTSIDIKNMTQDLWDSLSKAQREAARDLSELTKQLIGLEGWRVEVEDNYGNIRRFNVGRAYGWRPCHIEVKTSRSFGGFRADREYRRVTRIRKVR